VGWLEVGSQGVRDWEETHLHVDVVGDAEEVRHVLFAPQMCGCPGAAEAAGSQGKHEAPYRLDDRAPLARLPKDMRLRPGRIGAARDERKQQGGASVKVFEQVRGRGFDAIGAGHVFAHVAVFIKARDEVRHPTAIDVCRFGDDVRVVDDDPTPAVHVAAVRRLDGEF